MVVTADSEICKICECPVNIITARVLPAMIIFTYVFGLYLMFEIVHSTLYTLSMYLFIHMCIHVQPFTQLLGVKGRRWWSPSQICDCPMIILQEDAVNSNSHVWGTQKSSYRADDIGAENGRRKEQWGERHRIINEPGLVGKEWVVWCGCR